MHFPRFWARARDGAATAWGWSDTAPDEARERALESVKRIVARIRNGDRGLDRYYGERPLREPVLEEIRDPGGGLSAVITRNAYGCRVLNAAGAMFLDVDFPERSGVRGILGRLFGRRRTSDADPAASVTERAAAWCRDHPAWGFRLYRTFGGVRLLATHAVFDPAGGLTGPLCERLDVDARYVRLCAAQRSFRARLSPKPWREGLGRPPARWPWLDESSETAFRIWLGRYEEASEKRATCRFEGAVGNPVVDPRIAPLVEIHDRESRAASSLDLA